MRMNLHYQPAKEQIVATRHYSMSYEGYSEQYNYNSAVIKVRQNIVFTMHNCFSGLRHSLSVIFNEDDWPASHFWGIGGI